MKTWILALFLATSLAALVAGFDENDTLPEEDKPKFLPIKIETGKKRKSTEDILKHIGMSKMRGPWNYHKKRLASQGRKTPSGDSHMYIIKLPPNPYYYEDDLQKSASAANSPGRNFNRIPISFKSNGKPGKIYHWNLPMVKKMAARKTGGKASDANNIYKNQLWMGDQPKANRVTFYKPKKPSKQAFHKYFPGNGRPQSLYVIEKNRRGSSKHKIHP